MKLNSKSTVLYFITTRIETPDRTKPKGVFLWDSVSKFRIHRTKPSTKVLYDRHRTPSLYPVLLSVFPYLITQSQTPLEVGGPWKSSFTSLRIQ